MSETPSDQNVVPDGYWRDGIGRLWPEDRVSELDKMRDSLVRELAADVIAMSEALAQLKQRLYGDINSFLDLSAEKYNYRPRGSKGNFTLLSFDGRLKFEFARQEKITFDERLQTAKGLIDSCIAEWSAGIRPEVQTIIQSAFAADESGQLRPGRVLQLRRLDIQDERWKNAMAAISDAIQVTGSKWYIRLYQRRGDTDQYDQVPLNIAAL